MVESAQLPSRSLLEAQALWLAPARARLLRRAAIARRRSVLDLGAGYGVVTAELARRCGGRVIGLDREVAPLSPPEPPPRTGLVCGEACRLPFRDLFFDLVFCQCALMWMDAPAVLKEVHRVLDRQGVLAAIEPDYGGLIEYPGTIATRSLWEAGLKDAGADPHIGRKLPGLLADSGFNWRVELIPELHPPSEKRFQLLGGLPLTEKQRDQLKQVELAEASLKKELSPAVVHLPFFLVTAVKCDR